MEKNLKKYFNNFIRYILGALFLMMGLGSFLLHNYIASLLFILAAIVAIPPAANQLEKKLNTSMSGAVRFFVVFCLVALAFSAIPDDPVSVNKPAESIASPPSTTNGNEVNTVPAEPTKTPTEAVKSEESTPEPTKTAPDESKYQDTEWLAASIRISQDIATDLSNTGKAARNSEYVSLSNYGSTLYYDSCAAIEESNKYEVSPALQPAKDEFEEALSYSRDAGSNTVSGLYELNQGSESEAKKYLALAADNMKKCSEHAETGSRLVDEYKSKS